MPHLKLPAVTALFAGLAACTPMADMAGGVGPGGRGDDACGAAAQQALVGSSVGALDAASLPEPRRIIFPGQAVTMDFQAERFNVEIGADDNVARVFCG